VVLIKCRWLIVALAAGDISSASARPPLLPWWMIEQVDIGDLVQLRQTATFTGSGVRVCRALVNRSDRTLIINKYLAGGSNRDQITTWRFDAGGNMISSRDPNRTHSPYQLPIIPRDPEDISPYELVAPNGEVGDCENVPLPAGDMFYVVSKYSSDLDEPNVPRNFKQGRFVVARGQFTISGICTIRVRLRSIACTDERRWTVEPRPPGL